MRKPNGYGCIKRLSGNRRRPFVFVISKNGKQRPVEYFTNQIDAEIFQADYNKTHNHHSLPGHQITLEELYHRWLPAHTADTAPSKSTLCSYENSFKHLSSLHQEPFIDLKYMDYQRIIDGMRKSGLSYSSLKRCDHSFHCSLSMPAKSSWPTRTMLRSYPSERTSRSGHISRLVGRR